MTPDELQKALAEHAASMKRKSVAGEISSIVTPAVAYLLSSWAAQKAEDVAGWKTRNEDKMPLPEQEPKTAAPSGQENFIESPAQTLDWQKRVQDEAIGREIRDKAENRVMKGMLRKFAAKAKLPKEEPKEESKLPHPPLISYLDDVGMMLKNLRNSAPTIAENAIKMASPGEVIAARRAAMIQRSKTLAVPMHRNPELSDAKAASEKTAVDPLFAAGLAGLGAARMGHSILKIRRARMDKERGIFTHLIDTLRSRI